jgi:nifR3 family TIM-barrel protein
MTAEVLRTELNRDVPLARPGEFAPLHIGDLVVDPPIVLAPMAGITNAPFRTLCRRFSADRCLYVSEMITARAFVEGHARTLQLASFGPDEQTRKSIQLYGTNPDTLAQATKILVEEWGVHHIDMNFGCPVRKVTAAGGGAAIPVRPKLLQRIVRSVVKSAGATPVTIKFRKGIDESLLTYLDAGRIGEGEGARAVALHARTAAQLYSGEADWTAIATLKQHVTTIPVLGNGDVFEAFDALRMLRQTGCDGVVVGRGCSANSARRSPAPSRRRRRIWDASSTRCSSTRGSWRRSSANAAACCSSASSRAGTSRVSRARSACCRRCTR